jgi:hypothetical protein
MRIVWNIAGASLLAIGALWCGQGAGYVRGSFMTDDRKWLIIGAVTACIGVSLLLLAQSHKRARSLSPRTARPGCG